jgi:hypothetical protein
VEQADPLQFVGITGLGGWVSFLASKFKRHVDVCPVAVPRSRILPDFYEIIRYAPALEAARLLKSGFLAPKVAFHFLAGHPGFERLGI